MTAGALVWLVFPSLVAAWLWLGRRVRREFGVVLLPDYRWYADAVAGITAAYERLGPTAEAAAAQMRLAAGLARTRSLTLAEAQERLRR